MENNKYYTPTLNDFAEGLEYEWKFTSEGYTPFTHSFKFILPELQNIRIKHLDQSDIESLGFKYEGMRGKKQLYVKATSAHSIMAKTFNLSILKEDCLILIDNVSTRSTRKFDGVIKNKSELVKILEMIGYE